MFQIWKEAAITRNANYDTFLAQLHIDDTTYNSPVITMSASQTILLTQSQYYKTKV